MRSDGRCCHGERGGKRNPDCSGKPLLWPHSGCIPNARSCGEWTIRLNNAPTSRQCIAQARQGNSGTLWPCGYSRLSPNRISQMADVLITGASGFIGSAVLRAVLASRFTVRALVRPASPRQHLVGLDLEFCEGDLRDRRSVQRATSRRPLRVPRRSGLSFVVAAQI